MRLRSLRARQVSGYAEKSSGDLSRVGGLLQVPVYEKEYGESCYQAEFDPVAPEEFLREVERYKSQLREILNRFTKSGTPTISFRDDPKYRRMVREVKDFLDDQLGNSNEYSYEVWTRFCEGINNYSQTPSYASVQSIINELGALITRVKRNPDYLLAGSGVKGKRTNLSPKRVFIGHGHSPDWKEIKDFVVNRLNLHFEEFNREPAAGKSNKERLEEMLGTSGFALIIMTAEDEAKDGAFRARENVVHEAGLFQGKLGFERAIILREEDCKEFSNIEGLVQIPFRKGNVMGVSEKIREVLEREGILPKSRS